MIRFDDRVLLVTGGTAGIGLATAQLARELGGKVAVAGRDPERGRRAVGDLGEDALFIEADVAREADAARMVAAVLDRFARLDVLVNNAGAISRRPVHEEEPEAWDRLMGVNLRGVFLCCKCALPALIASRGAIVNVSSVLAFGSGAGRTPAYDASKAGVAALTRSLATRYGPEGVRANAVCPGLIPTDLNRDSWETWTNEHRAAIIQTYPLRRLGTPQDAARAILFLASDAASWITGAALLVDGGLTAV